MKICNDGKCPVHETNQCCGFCPEKIGCSHVCGELHPETCKSCEDVEMNLTTFNTSYMTIMKNIAGIVEQKKKLEADEKAMKDKLREAMEKFDIKSIDNDVMKITYIAPTVANSIDSAKLKKKYPAIAKECSKSSPKSGYIKIEVKDTPS